MPSRAYGVDVLEVGYRVRGGASLETHLALWDALSRAAVWLTGNGVNDAHGGRQNDWRTLTNRFVTTAVAQGTDEAALLRALAGGRVYVQELGGFAGLLETRVESCPMGSVSVRPDLARRVLTITATDLPKGSNLRVLQGLVDFGTAVDPAVEVAAVVPATALSTGSTDVVLSTTTSTFVRVELVTAAGRVVAFTNPIWLLTRQPPVAPTTARRAPDSR